MRLKKDYFPFGINKNKKTEFKINNRQIILNNGKCIKKIKIKNEYNYNYNYINNCITSSEENEIRNNLIIKKRIPKNIIIKIINIILKMKMKMKMKKLILK